MLLPWEVSLLARPYPALKCWSETTKCQFEVFLQWKEVAFWNFTGKRWSKHTDGFVFLFFKCVFLEMNVKCGLPQTGDFKTVFIDSASESFFCFGGRGAVFSGFTHKFSENVVWRHVSVSHYFVIRSLSVVSQKDIRLTFPIMCYALQFQAKKIHEKTALILLIGSIISQGTTVCVWEKELARVQIQAPYWWRILNPASVLRNEP